MCYRYNYSINSKWGYWPKSNDICNFIAFNGSIVSPLCFSSSCMKSMLSSLDFCQSRNGISKWF